MGVKGIGTRLIGVLILGFVAMLLAAGTAVANSGQQVDLRAELTGDEINGVEPRGEARFKQDSDDDEIRREFRAKVQDVNLAAGTELTVSVEGTEVGTIVLEDNNDGELRLRTDDGDEVPAMDEGDLVTIQDSAGNVILSGEFKKN